MEAVQILFLNQSCHHLPPRDICQYLEICFGCHSWGEGATNMQWIEDKDADEHLTMHNTAPHNKELSGQKYQVLRLRNSKLKSLNTFFKLLLKASPKALLIYLTSILQIKRASKSYCY